MTKDHPLVLLYKMVTPETTIYSYRNEGARVEVTVSHSEVRTWFLTVRMITMEELSFIGDILWKCYTTDSLEVDQKFSKLAHDINAGLTPNQLTDDLFIDGWGCAILDELNPMRLVN